MTLTHTVRALNFHIVIALYYALISRMAVSYFFSATPPFLHAQFSYQDMATVRNAHGELGVGFTSVSHKQQGDQN
jgi:hypothetical protein